MSSSAAGVTASASMAAQGPLEVQSHRDAWGLLEVQPPQGARGHQVEQLLL